MEEVANQTADMVQSGKFLLQKPLANFLIYEHRGRAG
jgi:hypothetical protein